MVGLSTLIFFSVSGGPFGLEVAVAAGGPARTLLVLLALALFAALPAALLTAELSSTLPGRGGFMYWVDRGLSPKLGALNGWPTLTGVTAGESCARPSSPTAGAAGSTTSLSAAPFGGGVAAVEAAAEACESMVSAGRWWGGLG